MMGSNFDFTDLSNHAIIVLPNNLRCGMVCFFKGATWVLEAMMLVVTVLPSTYTVL